VRTRSKVFSWAALIVAVGLVGAFVARADDHRTGVALRQQGYAEAQAELAKRALAEQVRPMKGGGLAAVAGGVRVRVTATEPQEILFPIPQLTGGQVPLCYFISATPAEAVSEFRLRARDDGGVVAVARLAGKKQEVRIAWSATVLLSPYEVTPERAKPDPFLKATACVQAETDEVSKLASALWPRTEKAADFAAGIQVHVRGMKRVERPATLDAVGILRSGENGICTANANLAAALMRAKAVPCRTVAVVPPGAGRLEMHRIAEYAEGGKWIPFDPSSLTADVPAKPWQNIIMARTTIPDEQAAMKPRAGAMRGCPYGQEAELLTPGVTLFGPDFFWTQAAPLAEFEPTEAATRRAGRDWTRFLETGALTPGQVAARSAKSAAELSELLDKK
jgi:hypothetical protein